MMELKRKLSRLWSQRGFRSVLILAGGTAAAQAIAGLAAPALTRLFNPAEFGQLAVYSGVSSLILSIVSLRYELAIPIPEDDERAISLLALTTVLTMGVSGLTGVVLVLLHWLHISPLGYWSLLPLSVMGGGFYQGLSYWALRRKAFAQITRTKLSQSLGMVGAQLALGLALPGPLGLIVGDAIGRVSGSGSLGMAVRREPLLRTISWSSIRSTAREFRNFPLFSAWSSLLNAASLQVPNVLLAAFFGNGVAGWFSLGFRVLQLPVTLLGQAFGQVFLSEAGQLKREGKLGYAVWQSFDSLVTLGIAPVLVLALVAPELFAFVFGQAWRGAGVYAQWLSPWLLFVFVASPLSAVTMVLERQRGELGFQAILFAGRVLALLLGYQSGSANVAMILYALVSCALWLGYTAWLLAISGCAIKQTMQTVVRAIAGATWKVAPIVIAKSFGVSGRILLWCVLLSCLLIAGSYVRRIGGGSQVEST